MAVGERLGDAYSDVASDRAQKQTRNHGGPAAPRAGSEASGAANPVVAAGRQAAQIVMGFAFGYIVAVLLRRR